MVGLSTKSKGHFLPHFFQYIYFSLGGRGMKGPFKILKLSFLFFKKQNPSLLPFTSLHVPFSHLFCILILVISLIIYFLLTFLSLGTLFTFFSSFTTSMFIFSFEHHSFFFTICKSSENKFFLSIATFQNLFEHAFKNYFLKFL